MKEDNIKKRAVTAAVIFLALAALFAVTNAVMSGMEKDTVRIDGKDYPKGTRSLDLVLMTEEGLDRLGEFDRLTEISITPYYAEVIRGIYEDGYIENEKKAQLRQEAEELYGQCTEVTDISFLRGLDTVKKVSLRYCGVSDVSPLAEMPALEEIDLSYTKTEDISPLYSLPGLKSIGLDGLLLSDEQQRLAEENGFSVIDERTDGERFVIQIMKEREKDETGTGTSGEIGS